MDASVQKACPLKLAVRANLFIDRVARLDRHFIHSSSNQGI